MRASCNPLLAAVASPHLYSRERHNVNTLKSPQTLACVVETIIIRYCLSNLAEMKFSFLPFFPQLPSCVLRILAGFFPLQSRAQYCQQVPLRLRQVQYRCRATYCLHLLDNRLRHRLRPQFQHLKIWRQS